MYQNSLEPSRPISELRKLFLITKIKKMQENPDYLQIQITNDTLTLLPENFARFLPLSFSLLLKLVFDSRVYTIQVERSQNNIN